MMLKGRRYDTVFVMSKEEKNFWNRQFKYYEEYMEQFVKSTEFILAINNMIFDDYNRQDFWDKEKQRIRDNIDSSNEDNGAKN